MRNKKVLFVTDLYFQAQRRNYYEEDIFLTKKIKNAFSILICHPLDINNYLDISDLIVFRNTGPLSRFASEYHTFYKTCKQNSIKTYNSLDGKADMKGKNYLIELTRKGYPLIPTIDNLNELDTLIHYKFKRYVIKPKNSADSIGLEFVDKQNIDKKIFKGNSDILIQPEINFQYEVSFYFIDNDFQYTLYAPDKSKRWDLTLYRASSEDIDFARKFIEWNDMHCGIQRVDACRTQNGELLLVELEDINPFLSLNCLPEETVQRFTEIFIQSLQRAMQ